MKNEVISNLVFSSFTILLGCMWYFAWVVPNTERMYSIMDCMTEIEDHSETGYRKCAEMTK